MIEGIAPFSEDNIAERKGPPVSQAFHDGKPTKAAIGFAKRYELSPEKLEIRETSKGSFVFAKSIEKGKPVTTVLSDYLPRWISKIQGRRFMRWGKEIFAFRDLFVGLFLCLIPKFCHLHLQGVIQKFKLVISQDHIGCMAQH